MSESECQTTERLSAEGRSKRRMMEPGVTVAQHYLLYTLSEKLHAQATREITRWCLLANIERQLVSRDSFHRIEERDV